MPRNVYWELYFHVVWRTKDSLRLLTPAIEAETHKFIVHRAVQSAGVTVHAIGGIEDHIHLAVSSPPTIEIAKWIGELKGASAHHVNHGPLGNIGLHWQTGYGVVSFGRGDLPWVVNYIHNQREHHQRGEDINRLERITNDDDRSIVNDSLRN